MTNEYIKNLNLQRLNKKEKLIKNKYAPSFVLLYFCLLKLYRDANQSQLKKNNNKKKQEKGVESKIFAHNKYE